ncbi:MAG: transposase [Acidobacteriota bacterium]
MKPRQLSLPLPTWGGHREGAGRKPKGPEPGVPHRALGSHRKGNPLHVTLKLREEFPRLRTGRILPVLERCFAAGKERFGFRLVHYSIQNDHIHLVAEATDERSLSSGVRGLSIRIARALNKELGLRGRVFGDRYHARELVVPLDVRNVLRYVLCNGSKHEVAAGRAPGRGIDPCSSGRYFHGWSGLRGVAEPGAGAPVVAPSTWLLRDGWLRHGRFQPADVAQRHYLAGSRAAGRRRSP